MADTVEMKIYQALLLRMQAFAAPTGVDVVMPGTSYTPTAQGRFVSVEVHFNRSIETDLSLEMDPIRQGILRTNVMWPKGAAIVDGYNLAGMILDHLKRGTKLVRNGTQVRIDEAPEIGSLVTGDTHHTIPVTSRWNCQPHVPA